MDQPPGAEEQWLKFLQKCLARRPDERTFLSLVQQMQKRSPLQSPELCRILLSEQVYPSNTNSILFIADPLYLAYIRTLVSSDVINITDVLDALLDNSTTVDLGKTERDGQDGSKSSSREYVEAAILTTLSQLVPSLTPSSLSSRESQQALMVVICKLMNAVIAAGDGDGNGGALNDTGLADLGLGLATMGVLKRDAVGELIAAIGENSTLGGWMKGGLGHDKAMSFESTLQMFTQKYQQSNPNLANRLDVIIPKSIGQLQGGGMGMSISLGAAHNDGLMGMNGGGQLTRGGTFIFFNSLFVGVPLVDDDFLLNWLRNRYSGNTASAAVDMIIAVFDCVASANKRTETRSNGSLYRHFLVNKIPTLLVKMQFAPEVAFFVLSQAIIKSDTSALMDSIVDSMMLDLPNDVKSEFLFSCALHGLIQEIQIQEILGEVPLQIMAAKKYTAQDLIELCTQDPERAEHFVDEIEEMEGNSGAIVAAVIEVMRTMCENKETMSLRNVCNRLTRKPETIDLLFLYVKPSYVLEPLCHLLDSWRYDDDQGEYQPVYEEFGYVLLLVLTIIHRYGLTTADLGSVVGDQFIPQLLKRGTQDTPLGQLDDEKNKLLGGWIRALFCDGEGISDDLYSSCLPQDFLFLIPTLFFNCVEACNSGRLSLEAMKGGVEYLHLSFLIASQLNAIFWLTNYLWEKHPNKLNALKILHALMIPDSKLDPEVAQTHHTIISIASRKLDGVLKELTSDPTLYQTAEQIRRTLASHSSFTRSSSYVAPSELDSWKSGGGLEKHLRSYIQSLVRWSSSPEMQTQPPHYNHRLLLFAVNTLGAKTVMRALLDETIALHSNSGILSINAGELATDLVVSMITAPDARTFNLRCTEVSTGSRFTVVQVIDKVQRISLVEALRLLEEDTKLAMEEPTRGDIIMKLARQVNAQMNVSIFKGVDTTMGGTGDGEISMGAGDFGMVDNSMEGM